MSKAGKRGKSGDVKGGPAGGGKWDQVLSSCAFQEESWNPCVTWIVGRQAEDSKHIEALNVVIQTGTRKLFSVVTKELLLADVRDLGNPKNKKVKETPANSEVCEACKPYIDAGEAIPVPLMAKLIKWKLMAIKVADLKRREGEAKALKAKAAGDKKKAGKDNKDAGKDRAKSPKKGGKKTPEPQTAKDGSKLRRRGEEDSDSKYIDDEPDDGSDHYILVTGFHDPRLFQFLEEIKVTVNSVIGIGSQDYGPLTRPAPEAEPPAEPTEEDRKFEELQHELQVFWTDLLPLLQRLPDSSCLHDIARLDYEVKSLMVPSDANDTEQRVQYSTALFEDIAVMIYDLLDAKRLYQTYLENLKLTRVSVYGQEEVTAVTPVPPPTPGQALAAPGATGGGMEAGGTVAAPLERRTPPPPVDMRYYTDLMNTVPQESVSVSLIMHCMLEQITATEEGKEPPSEQAPPSRPDGLNFHMASYLTGIAFKLGLSESEHQALSEVLELPSPPPEQPGPPELINVQDDISNRTQHLQQHYGFNPGAVERAMLQFVPFAKLCMLQQRPASAESRLRAARLQELIHYCARENLSKSEIDRAFKQFVFESMDLAKVDTNGFILEKDKEGVQHTAIPWDDPYPFFKVMLPHPRRPSADIRYTSLSSEESRSAMAVHTQTLQQQNGALGSQGKINGKKFGGTGRGACTPEVPVSDSESKQGSDAGDESRKKSILIANKNSPRAASPRRSRSNSVHWDADVMADEPPQDLQDPELPPDMRAKTVEEGVLEMVEAQQRNLDQWCFAEHFKPHILLQVLREASYMLPFYETYYHKRDETTMLVLHNPYGSELHNHVDWHKELHSNMGFRNYLECTAESISEWLKEKEAEYQAHLLSKEVESINKEEEEKAKAAEKAEAKGKKSPRKSPSRSKSPRGGSRTSSVERSSSQASNPYVRAGSLKAWQADQDKLAQEEGEKERAKAEKRTRSANKLKEKEEKEKAEKAAKSPRGSARSRKSTSVTEADHAPPPSQPEPVEQEQEPFWPFYGYDTGNQLIHVSGIKTTLFPSDGGTIKTERTEFVHGTTAIRSVLQKDEHVFSIHVLNPREDMDLPEEYEALLESQAMAAAAARAGESGDGQDGRNSGGSGLTDETGADNRGEISTAEKSEYEKSEKEDPEKTTSTPRVEGTDSGRSRAHRPAVSQFGSVTAQLSDGMILALSQFGHTGESYLKPYQPAQYISPPSVVESPSAPQTAASPSKGKKEAPKKGQTPEVEKPALDEADHQEEEKKDEEKPMPKQDFQELFVTCPDGLTVKYFLQSSIGVTPPTPEDRQLAVRQSYPFKTKGFQSCEGARNDYIQSEISRVITPDGNVVKNMVDGSVQVLSADGTVSKFTGAWPLPPSRSASPARSTKSNHDQGRDSPVKKGKGSGKGRRQANQPEVEVEEEVKLEGSAPTWTITYPSGERLQLNKDTGDFQELSSVPVCLATDPDTSQTMATRDDHVITVSYPDGTTVVEHADGTRITVYYRETAMPSDDNDDVSSAAVSTQTLKFVKVECPAFATIEFNTATSENLTVFGSGTSINVFPDGYYILHHSKGGRVEVDTEGTMVYFPRRSRFLEHLMPERELQYVLRHNADVILETVDPDGNVFNVRSTGDFNVIPAQSEDACSVDSDDNISKPKKIIQYGQHAPRFFIIHGDGSGTELLRYQDVAEYLMLAEQNPATAVLKDALPDHPGVKGITVLKPYILGLSEKWFKNYDQDSIVPKGIRCRDLKTLPPKEYVKPGPKFGTNVGRGLNVGAANKGPIRVPILKCPSKLELRQLVQYKPMVDSLRDVLRGGLRAYAEAVVSRMRAEALTSIDDMRSVDEKMLAQDLNVLAQMQRQEAQDFEPDHVKTTYEAAVAPPPPSPPHTPQPKRTLADWERDRREKEEEVEAKGKLKNKTIEPYFTSELGKTFLLTQASDMEDMMQQLSEDPRRDGSEAVRGSHTESRLTYTHSPMYNNSNQPPVPPSQPRASVLSDRSVTSESPGTQPNVKNGQETPLSYAAGMSEAATVTPSGNVRPHNPTPGHATGQGSPVPLRPHNPTPAHAGKMQTDRPDTQLTSADRELARQRALTTNVVGEPRAESVPLPVAIKGGRPGALPNVKYHTIEDPVRRQVRTSLVAGAAERGRMSQLSGMRGLICQPEGVNFGVLKEGCTYRYAVTLRNTGVDTCRYKIRQPPPATGLRVIYKPGPVAAGMSVELALELFAIANGVEGESGVGSLGHVLEIITETDVLELPIVATILTAHEYDNPGVPHATMRNTSARLISTRPPASTGIIRPRRDNRAVPAS